MKRELFQNVKVLPIIDGVVEKTGFLSGIICALIDSDGPLTITITHSDDNITYEAVTDKMVFPDKPTEGGTFTTEELTANDVVNIDVDLAGLKNYVKITGEGSAALAIALGDKSVQPEASNKNVPS